MHGDGSRLLGLAGLRMTGVLEGEDDALDLEVESVEPAGACPHCGGEDLVIKERPVVGVRALALAGRAARLLWRKRRWRCRGWAAHPVWRAGTGSASTPNCATRTGCGRSAAAPADSSPWLCNAAAVNTRARCRARPARRNSTNRGAGAAASRAGHACRHGR